MEPTVYISPTPFYKNRLFLVLIFIAILILIPLSFYLFKIYFLKAPQIKPGLNEGELPIALNILQNPMVYEWRGSVEGTLTAKDDRSFTLNDKDNNKIIIRIIASSKDTTGTKFYKSEPVPDKDGRKFTEVNINDITIGTKLHGDFFVFPHNKNELVGSSFNIVEP